MSSILGSLQDRIGKISDFVSRRSDDRNEDSETPSVAQLEQRVTARQRGRTSRKDELEIRDILLGVRGAELTELKERIDFGDDHRDLQQLVYHDIDDSEIRAAILDHVRREAESLRRANGGRGVRLKVLSDIDDTLYPNFGDKRDWGPGKPVYPGILELYRALTGEPREGRNGLVLVSARPGERTGGLERGSSEKLRSMGVPPHTILSGGLATLTSVLPGKLGARGVRKIGEKKLQNLLEWCGLMGEFDVVISGDLTQADHVFGAAALDHPDTRDRVRAVFIHEVGSQQRIEREGIFYNRTALGHALDAFRHPEKLIDRQGLESVHRAVQAKRGAYPSELKAAVDADLAEAAAIPP